MKKSGSHFPVRHLQTSWSCGVGSRTEPGCCRTLSWQYLPQDRMRERRPAGLGDQDRGTGSGGLSLWITHPSPKPNLPGMCNDACLDQTRSSTPLSKYKQFHHFSLSHGYGQGLSHRDLTLPDQHSHVLPAPALIPLRPISTQQPVWS